MLRTYLTTARVAEILPFHTHLLCEKVPECAHDRSHHSSFSSLHDHVSSHQVTPPTQSPVTLLQRRLVRFPLHLLETLVQHSNNLNSHFMHSSLCFAISELGMSCSQMRQRSKSSFFLSACATHHLVNASLTRSIAFLLKPLSSPLLPLLTAGLHRFQFRVLHHLTIRDLRTQILVILSQ